MSDIKAKFVAGICQTVHNLKEEDLTCQIAFLRPEYADVADIASKFDIGSIKSETPIEGNTIQSPTRGVIDDDELDSGILISPTKPIS